MVEGTYDNVSYLLTSIEETKVFLPPRNLFFRRRFATALIEKRCGIKTAAIVPKVETIAAMTDVELVGVPPQSRTSKGSFDMVEVPY
jgi:hypothetical protein